MKNDHVLHYLILLLGLSVSAFFFVYFKFVPSSQLLALGIGSLYYCLWGIVHHALERRLTTLIALEYTLFGLLIFYLLFAASSI